MQIMLLGNNDSAMYRIRDILLQGGYQQTVIVHTPDEAIQFISDSPPDAVIVDTGVPPDEEFFISATRLLREYGIPVICADHNAIKKAGAVSVQGVSIIAQPIENGDICSILSGILKLKTPDNSIDNSEEFFRLMIEDGSDMILILNEAGDVMYQSPSIKRILGYTMEELDGRQITEFIYFEDLEKFYDSFTRFLQNPLYAPPLELRVFHKDGTLRNIEAKAKNFSRHPSIRGVITNCRDITDRKKIELELHKVQKLESLGILAGGIAHDFNNILTSIIGNIALIKMDIDPGSEIFDALADAEKASYRARDLTQQLLTFSKGGSPVRKITSIGPLLEETASFTLHGCQIRCDVHVPPDLWLVDIDEGQVSQVMNNLLINAIQAMSESGSIEIEAANIRIEDTQHPLLPQGEYVRISVSDQGTGIPASLLTKIFDPYFTTKRDGSGLGLSTAYSIIKNHGGSIEVESELGIGSCFHVYIPRSTGTSPPQDEPLEGEFRGDGRILLMDDDEQVLRITEKILSRIGYDVDTVSEGAEAFDYYVKAVDDGNPYDAVILDLTIRGGLSGKATLEAIRQIDPGVIAIVASGYSNNPIMADFKKYGFSAGIRKPFRIDELNKVLSTLLKKS